MSYRLSSKKRQQRKNFWLKTIGALFLFGIALGIFMLLGGTVASVGSGVVATTNGARDFVSVATVDKQDLIETNKALQQELDQVRVDGVAFAALKDRNQDLTRLLGRAEDLQKIAAGVIKKPPFSPYDIYTTDAGSDDGVSLGDLTLFSDFIALGQVVRVNNTGAKTLLFSAPQNNTFMNLNETLFEIVGQGGGTMRVDVPRDFEVSEGDALTLPGYEVYVTGIISEVSFNPQDSFKKVFAKVPVNIESVDVIVTTPYRAYTNDEITEVSDTE